MIKLCMTFLYMCWEARPTGFTAAKPNFLVVKVVAVGAHEFGFFVAYLASPLEGMLG